MDFNEDLADMLDPEDFGDVAAFGGITVDGIYDVETVEMAAGHGFVMSKVHTFTCQQTALPEWAGKGTELGIAGGAFVVGKIDTDDSGLVELTLEVIK
jgi:hypothetical protein